MSGWDDIVGAEHVRPGTPADAVDGVVPARVVHPGSVGEVQACVRAAAERKQAIVARGLGRHLDIGAPPARLDVVLALDRLDRVLDHQAGDMTVTVEAGCSLPRLADALGAAGQWLPLDPPAPDATTAGGLIAANLSGPLRASQGRVRDLLLGLKTVGADGALVSGGGRVVKNVAGYDLPKLHVGALGTVGVIVEATFKVRPRSEREEALVIPCRSVESAAETALGILDGPVVPAWLETAGAGALPEGPGEAAAVIVGLAGIAAEVDHGRAGIVAAMRARGLRAVVVEDGGALRARLAAFPVEPAAAVLRAAMLPTAVGELMAAVTARGRGTVRCLAHAASGVVRIAAMDGAAVPSLVSALRPGLEAHGGSLVVERAVPAVKRELDVWGDPGPGFPLMRALKEKFDPAGIFAPGRFVGGI